MVEVKVVVTASGHEAPHQGHGHGSRQHNGRFSPKSTNMPNLACLQADTALNQLTARVKRRLEPCLSHYRLTMPVEYQVLPRFLSIFSYTSTVRFETSNDFSRA